MMMIDFLTLIYENPYEICVSFLFHIMRDIFSTFLESITLGIDSNKILAYLHIMFFFSFSFFSPPTFGISEVERVH